MTRRILLRAAVLSIAFAVLAGGVAFAQDDDPSDPGTVWDITYVRTEPGHFEDYLRDLQQGWKRVNDAAIEQGHIVSYKILSAQPGDLHDWDLMLLVEYPNWATFDGGEEKFDPIVAEVFGSETGAQAATVERTKLRTILGGKTAQEQILK